MVLKLNEASCAGMVSTVATPPELNSFEMLAKPDFKSANYSKSTPKPVEGPEQPHIGLYSAKELADEKEFTDKLTPQDLATRAAKMINRVSPHEAIKAGIRTVILNLDFTKPHSFWVGQDFATYRKTLLETLPWYHFIAKKLLITLVFPDYRGQSKAVKLTQKDLVNRIATLVDEFPMMDDITVVFRSPETNWQQIESLAPLYQIRGKWTCTIKEGQQSPRSLRCGDAWDQKLKGRYRTMLEQRELYQQA
jgi:hypothetical protein